jgi:hypothetical protein
VEPSDAPLVSSVILDFDGLTISPWTTEVIEVAVFPEAEKVYVPLDKLLSLIVHGEL